MANLEDTVRSVVKDFIGKGVLFTALDVSNAVKQQLPLTKHREVREVVLGMFTTDIEGQGWARTPITVNLSDGTTAEALLYHPLTDSWDLDNKYNTQARQAVSYRPGASAGITFTATQGLTVSATNVTVPGTLSATTPAVSAPVLSPSDQWASLFQNQPSLFPKR